MCKRKKNTGVLDGSVIVPMLLTAAKKL
jgi:hypothetical protein